MCEERDKTFTFTWRIKNFSMSPVIMSESISSPVFKVKRFGNSEWNLHLFPKGFMSEDFIGCYLNCRSLDPSISTIHVKFCLRVSTVEKSDECFFKPDKNAGFPEFIPINDVSNEKEKYLPNDVLTIKCIMRCKDPLDQAEEVKHKQADMNEIRDCSLEGKNNDLRLFQCCGETTIKVDTKSVFWTIPKIEFLSVGKIRFLPVRSSIKDSPSFLIRITKSSDSAFLVISIKSDDFSGSPVHIKCRLSIFCYDGEKYSFEDYFLFKKRSDLWFFCPFIQLSDLEKDGYLESTGGKLYLKFDFDFSIEDKISYSEKQEGNPVLLPNKNELPVETTDDEPFIVTLMAGQQSFKVHRSVLESKSEVFRAMFKNDMKEKETGVVDITDMDPNIVADMLQFLYTNTVGNHDLSVKDIAKLYTAGAKYQIESLLSRCCSILVSLLSVSNVCSILEFAMLHDDQRLLEHAQQFVEINSDRVLISKEWKEFMERSGTLAAKVLHKLLIQ